MAKRVFGIWFKRPSGQAEARRHPNEGSPTAGEIYAFRTAPFSEFAPPNTGRVAAFKLLGVNEKHVTIAVLDRIWPSIPPLREAEKAKILLEKRFNHTGQPAVFGVNRDWWKPGDDLRDVAVLGIGRVTKEERAYADAIARHAVGTRYSSLGWANYAAEGEWRWAHDRDAFIAESELRDAKNEAQRAAKEERYRTRLSKLTWEHLLSEIPFARWTPSPPFPPADFVLAARATIHDACRRLKHLGPKPRRPEVREILKETVLWFNHADEQAGGVIETEEREDICAVLEEMAFVARQKVLVDEIDEWREW